MDQDVGRGRRVHRRLEPGLSLHAGMDGWRRRCYFLFQPEKQYNNYRTRGHSQFVYLIPSHMCGCDVRMRVWRGAEEKEEHSGGRRREKFSQPT